MCRDVVDHVGVVVRRQESLAGAAVLHRQPPDEVGQPCVVGTLLARVLVEVVVELPRLVADPQVVAVLAHDVVEDHEVGDQDLVHPSPRLEAVKVVLGGLGLDVGRLARQVLARRVDGLALSFEDSRDRVLGKPVDLDVRDELAQLLGDGHVALGVSQPDRRRDVESAGTAVGAVHRRVAPVPVSLGELSQGDVDGHGLAGVRHVADPLERQHLAAGRPGQRLAVGEVGDPVIGAMDDEDRAADLRGQGQLGCCGFTGAARAAAVERIEVLGADLLRPYPPCPRSAWWSGAPGRSGRRTIRRSRGSSTRSELR